MLFLFEKNPKTTKLLGTFQFLMAKSDGFFRLLTDFKFDH